MACSSFLALLVFFIAYGGLVMYEYKRYQIEKMKDEQNAAIFRKYYKNFPLMSIPSSVNDRSIIKSKSHSMREYYAQLERERDWLPLDENAFAFHRKQEKGTRRKLNTNYVRPGRPEQPVRHLKCGGKLVCDRR
ncbi:uncharacterized protein LOC101448274 [Ceratitis capitata]|uniref:uncharacterized protein LOC101448274 n=1 Tax=Ceratitis capitata TaxID=7213 RepID=UPI000329E458|nr:uncharacterized protein LOC101448274 [Ceratitis capitata]